jgi:hypothetical protein
MVCGLPLATACRADAPPYATTDTAIADKLELISFVQSAAHDGAHFNAVGFDLAIPITARLEMTIVPRFAWLSGPEGRRLGLGDTEVALKYLVLSETGNRPAVAFEPNVTFPTGGRLRGEGRVAVELPVLVSKTFGPWRLSGEAAYEREGSTARDDHASVSMLVEREVREGLSLGVEFAKDLPMRKLGSGSTDLNVGESWALRDGLQLNSMFGRRFSSRDEPADFHGCVAFAFEF